MSLNLSPGLAFASFHTGLERRLYSLAALIARCPALLYTASSHEDLNSCGGFLGNHWSPHNPLHRRGRHRCIRRGLFRKRNQSFLLAYTLIVIPPPFFVRP